MGQTLGSENETEETTQAADGVAEVRNVETPFPPPHAPPTHTKVNVKLSLYQLKKIREDVIIDRVKLPIFTKEENFNYRNKLSHHGTPSLKLLSNF